jgi:hypothetical protein
MKTKLTHTEMLNAFRDATAGKQVDLSVSAVAALVDSIAAETHDEAVNEILIELGWKEREPQPGTKAAAISCLEKAGYNAETVPGGIVVKAADWEAFFADSGQDGNTYSGNVPPEVETLAVWDDPTTRTA